MLKENVLLLGLSSVDSSTILKPVHILICDHLLLSLFISLGLFSSSADASLIDG